jgi:nucleotide-binding universal stress UspA family protein
VKRILIATDGSPHARRAVAFAADLAKHYDAEMLVTHVLSGERLSAEDRHLIETEYASEVSDRVRQAQSQDLGSSEAIPLAAPFEFEMTATVIEDLLGERLLQSAEAYARECGATRVHTILARGEPAKTILSIADEDNIDLIVVASRGLGEMRSLLLGSVSSKIAHMAKCSVVLVK